MSHHLIIKTLINTPEFSSSAASITITFNSSAQKIKIPLSWRKRDDMMDFLKNQMMFKNQSEQMKMEKEREDRKLHIQIL